MALYLKTSKEKYLHRLKIARGHINKVIQMAEKDTYCIDILHQSQAVQKALQQVDMLIMQNHLQTCTADAIKSGKSKKAIEEIMEVLKRNR
ncbi:MAG TPA: metal-sensing transcriptional repressor [Candidatus Levybacteria bacterium]|nr:metal-sensing transcriptional repressor [Candidatus Levybacteria bacterium]